MRVTVQFKDIDAEAGSEGASMTPHDAAIVCLEHFAHYAGLDAAFETRSISLAGAGVAKSYFDGWSRLVSQKLLEAFVRQGVEGAEAFVRSTVSLPPAETARDALPSGTVRVTQAIRDEHGRITHSITREVTAAEAERLETRGV